jgi:hypothetical protein
MFSQEDADLRTRVSSGSGVVLRDPGFLIKSVFRSGVDLHHH